MKKFIIVGSIIVVILFSVIFIKHNLYQDNYTLKYFEPSNIESYPNGQEGLKEYLPNKYKLTSTDKKYLKDNKIYENLINYNMEAKELAIKGLEAINKNSSSINKIELNFSNFSAKTYIYYRYPITENQKNIVNYIIKIWSLLNNSDANTVGELNIQEKINLKKWMQAIKKLATEQ
ncbi:hypothetical protein [Clostridium thermobutyricum]|uniref:hypothetical protein n=1 Tax=Clostridium thermobutyricum TaxID=29372 RepID=UPI0029437E37|nr:hypothetical protein [Clostridium thermobutyricum]